MKNTIKDLTEGMQRLCAVANRIVAQDGQASRIEVDLLMEDLRSPVRNVVIEFHIQYRVGFHGGRAFRVRFRQTRNHGRNHANFNKEIDYQGNQRANKGRKYNFREFHDFEY